MESILRLGADELRRSYLRREVSPVEVIDAVATRIERTDPVLNMFVTPCLEEARSAAKLAQRRFAEGAERALEGIPIAVKDLFDTEGVRTTYGSSIFASHLPDADAVAVRRAREAGAIVVGKTATHEFAWGITCDNPHYGACRNPWDTARISGGSSGGSAVALAAGVVPLALGSDTGGSIRIPAAFCGVTGLKPTYDQVSLAGIFPLAPSLDHAGPMARRPSDAWRLYEVIAGADRRRHRHEALDPISPDARRLDGRRVGICRDLHGIELAEDVERVLADAAATVEQLGGTIIELEFPHKDLIGSSFATIQRVEALDTHRRRGLFPRKSPAYGADVRARLKQAVELSLHDYLRAAVDRARVGAGFAAIFGEADLLLTPVSAAAPIRVGERTGLHHGREVEFRDLVMGATMPQNLAGLPACTVRGGFDSDGIPVGLQVTAPQGGEALAVAAAEGLFEATPEIQERWPNLG